MAYKPQFGGTNGVAELDVGQELSPRRSGGTALATLHTLLGPPQTRDVAVALPQQSQTFVERMGWSGQEVRWLGSIKFSNATAMAAVISDLNLYRTGQSISAGGERSSVDVTRMAATKLVDAYGVVNSDKAVMADWRLGRRHKTTGSHTIWCNVEIVFTVLG